MSGKWGIHGIGDVRGTDPNFIKYKPVMTGWRIRTNAANCNPSTGVYDFSSIIAMWDVLKSNGLYLIQQFTYAPSSATGYNTPAFEFIPPDSVPKVFTTNSGASWYPDYYNAAYKTWRDGFFTASFASMNAYNFGGFLIGLLSSEGKTGDPGAQSGTVNKVTINGVNQANFAAYQIDEKSTLWQAYKHDIWLNKLYGHITNGVLGVNQGNDGSNFQWAKDNIPGQNVFFKNGGPTHSYNINGEKYAALRVQSSRSETNPNKLRWVGECEQSLLLAWFQQYLKGNIYALILQCIHYGYDVVNISNANMETLVAGDMWLFQLANRHLGVRTAADTIAGVCSFRDIIDPADLVRFPEDGTWHELIAPADLKAYNNRVTNINSDPTLSQEEKYDRLSGLLVNGKSGSTYINSARLTALDAAFTTAQRRTFSTDQDADVLNQDYIINAIAGNYENWIHQWSPNTTSIGYWRHGMTTASFHGRFARGFDIAHGKGKIWMYADTDLMPDNNYKVTIDVYYRDTGVNQWKLKYHNGTAEVYSDTVTHGGSGLWLKKTFTINDMQGGQHISNGTDAQGIDFVLEAISGDSVFSAIEFTRVSQNYIMPTAEAGSNQTIQLPVSTASLSAIGSVAGSGTITGYLWTKLSGPSCSITSPTSRDTTITGLSAGTYVLQVEVTNSFSLVDTDTVTVVVLAANIPPIADAGANQAITLPTDGVNLDGTGSHDPDGSIVDWLWTLEPGSTAGGVLSGQTTPTPLVTLMSAGVNTYKLRVTDNSGAVAYATTTVTVNASVPVNIPPTAHAGADQTITLPTSSATLNGSTSIDGDGSITAYLWSCTSGPNVPVITSPASAITTVTGMIRGTYTYKLKVTDNLGSTDHDSMTVTVKRGNKATAVAGGNQILVLT